MTKVANWKSYHTSFEIHLILTFVIRVGGHRGILNFRVTEAVGEFPLNIALPSRC